MFPLEYKFHVLERKILISLSHQNFFITRSTHNSHSFFLWVVLLNLTIFWVRENNAFISRTQKTVNVKAELFGAKLSTNNSMSDFAWHAPGSFYIYSVFTWRHGFHIGGCRDVSWKYGIDTVEILFMGGHPRDKCKGSLNRGVPWMEVGLDFSVFYLGIFCGHYFKQLDNV